ncbi:Branched-chain amino acid ABC transporter, amino acid-binding protein [Labilithrix luteola]|uniref:Branched-chain amino acid ABC transporter, amino acid-binding protein n=1 Tax=Labilithrix luteola TaxID=1391654 RepID=A0A0K1QCT7_9BACT|nr:ABC transporter substrate-binding protein [Labilithrix luteola]AKV03477.1 Branched-chain amino acid ABC transporter, amino acid-binding protein [Labilithrix luteola]
MLAGVALAAAAVTVGQGCSDSAPAPSAPKPIVIGVSLGLTGGLDAFSAPLRDAVRVAEGQINAAGGVLGRPVVFDVQDDTSDESQGIVDRVAHDFVKKGAVAVIGPIGSQQVVKTQQIYRDAHIVQICPSATSTELTGIQPTDDRWLFRTTPADDFQGAAVLLFAKRTPRGLGSDGGTTTPGPVDTDAGDGGGTPAPSPPAHCSKLAIVNVDNAYGNSMADVIEQNFPKQGGQPLLTRKRVSVLLAPGYQDVASSIHDLAPDCLALIAYDDVASQFVRDFKADPRYAALAAKGFFFIGTDGIYTDGFLKRSRENASDPTSPNVAEGVYGTNPDTQPGTPEYNQFKTIYSSYFPIPDGKEAPAFAANTYDAAILIALAIQQAGTVDDRVAIRNALLAVANPPGKSFGPSQLGDALQAIQQKQEIDYKGASGAIDLEPNGNVKAGFIVWEAHRAPDKTVDYRTVGRFSLEELVEQLK